MEKCNKDKQKNKHWVTVGNRINSLLAEQDKTQKELAEKLKIKPNVISYFCKGDRTPNTEQIVEIAKFFNVSTDYLLGLRDVKSTDTTVQGVCEYLGCNDVEAVEKIKYLFSTHAVRWFGEEAQTEFSFVVNSLLKSDEIEQFVTSVYFIYNESNKHVNELKNDIGFLGLNCISSLCTAFALDPSDFFKLTDKYKSEMTNDRVRKSISLDEQIDLSRYRANQFLENVLNKYDKRAEVDSCKTKEQWLEFFDMSEQEFYNFLDLNK